MKPMSYGYQAREMFRAITTLQSREDGVMKKTLLYILSLFIAMILTAPFASSHCEIPCGIYDDEMRIKMIAEHIGTIEKSMKQIIELQDRYPAGANQLVRWVSNKEHHANEIQTIVSRYFMTQRIKFGADNYEKKIALLHKMLVYAMKCKQTTDQSHAAALKSALNEFKYLYFSRKKN
jgi:nickel superoxide dismutase